MNPPMSCPPRWPIVRKALARCAAGLLVACAAGLSAGAAQAQFFSVCDRGDAAELEQNINRHTEHMFRLTQGKFSTGWYWQGAIPKDFPRLRLSQLRIPPGFAVLFYVHDSTRRRLCVWHIGSAGQLAWASTSSITADDMRTMRSRFATALGAEPPGPLREPGVVEAISRQLLPGDLVAGIIAAKAARLLVVPIFELGAIPFVALTISPGRPLLEVAAVTMLPGFFALTEEPRVPRGRPNESVVVGDPQVPASAGAGLPRLAFARRAAEEIGSELGVPVLADDRGSAKAVKERLAQAQPRFVVIAAHGVSNADDPLEGGYLLMADGRWRGVEVAHGVAMKSAPLVVLAGCETGVGKGFDVGLIGLARAWYQAGASGVVSSLWRVDEKTTQEFVVGFVKLALMHPPDIALRKAMLVLRDDRKAEALHWASFALLGGVPLY
ncbi:MAG: CHAT domain-containing protein [Burkholderiales bacterium]|nr:CHAT domain-containing protein [Burkholderiales bacterium]